MAKKMLIDAAHPEETRVVVVDGNRVEEFDYESIAKLQLAGNIYLAKVTRVEPSLQAAFVEYGGNRHGFLAFAEVHPDYYQIPKADREALLAAERAAAAAAEAREADEERAALDGDEDGKRRNGRRRRGRKPRGGEEAATGAEEAKPAKPRRGALELNGLADAELPAGALGLAAGAGWSGGPAMAGEALEAAVAAFESAAEARVAAAAEAAQPGGGDDHDAAEGAPIDLSDVDEVVIREIDADSGDVVERPLMTGGALAEAAGASGESVQAPAPAEARGDDDADAADEDAAERDAAAEADADAPSDDDEGSVRGGRRAAARGDIEDLGDDDVREEVRPRALKMRDYKIQEVIKRRQIMLVQVVKEERGTKGAALTTYLSLAGRYCVLMPNTARGGGISRKITNIPDRKRLKSLAQELEVPDGMGLIIRTAGAQRTKSEIKRDYEYLLRQWLAIRDLTLQSSAPALIYEEGSLIKRAIRDLYNKDIEAVQVEGEEGYREAKDYMKLLMPSHARNVQPYRDRTPLLIRHQVESHLAAMMDPTVHLPSGGYIVIGVTEALVAIDVNSGRSTKEGSIEETALKTNLEAAEEVARQLRLRDLAGLIVIDFIDMEESKNNRAVEKRFKDKLKNDRARLQIGRISGFGLLEMSRQRLRPGLLEATTVCCPTCNGVGVVRSNDSLALSILREVEEEGVRRRSAAVKVTASPAIANFLMNVKRARLALIEDRYDMQVIIEAAAELIGQAYRLDRVKPVQREEPLRTAIQIESGFIDEDEEYEDEAPEIDADHEDPPAAEEAEARAERDDEGAGEEGRERKGRRRRRRRRGDEPAEGDAAPEEARAEPRDAAAEGEEDGARGGRRRGRRGGRGRAGAGDDPLPVIDLDAEADAETAPRANGAAAAEATVTETADADADADEIAAPSEDERDGALEEPAADAARPVRQATADDALAEDDELEPAADDAGDDAGDDAADPGPGVGAGDPPPPQKRRTGWWALRRGL